MNKKAPDELLGMTGDAGVELWCQRPNLDGDSYWETVWCISPATGLLPISFQKAQSDGQGYIGVLALQAWSLVTRAGLCFDGGCTAASTSFQQLTMVGGSQ